MEACTGVTFSLFHSALSKLTQPKVAEFAIQVDKVMAMLLKERVDDEHDKLTRDDAEAFLKDRAPVIIQGLL
jgi:hypothetical protein